MLPRPKFKVDLNKDDKNLLYVFKNKAQFENCVKNKCSLVSENNSYDATELISSIDLVSSLAIEMWRLDKRVNKVLAESPIDNSIVDQIQRIKDIFRKQDVEICEHTDTEYNDGMSVKVLHVEEVDNLPLGKMKVLETVKPSVYLKGQVISHGEIIVGKSKEKAKKE